MIDSGVDSPRRPHTLTQGDESAMNRVQASARPDACNVDCEAEALGLEAVGRALYLLRQRTRSTTIDRA
jgi:hypothetical protein